VVERTRHEEGCAVQRYTSWMEEWAPKRGGWGREKCFSLKISPVIQSQRLLLLFSWGLGERLRGGGVATKEEVFAMHIYTYLLHRRRGRDGLWALSLVMSELVAPCAMVCVCSSAQVAAQ
jgi:hypothetical protein